MKEALIVQFKVKVKINLNKIYGYKKGKIIKL